ncbi:Kinesin-like protein KIFC3 [Chelonia mydas]|uniref:Kinesin-like protein n=1 Tax=Chelonia mydas TaxID=8469 RepID=M7ASN2_CHEMY|nr:Kinesin-like protein KIFC3 [Chelonia mydas]
MQKGCRVGRGIRVLKNSSNAETKEEIQSSLEQQLGVFLPYRGPLQGTAANRTAPIFGILLSSGINQLPKRQAAAATYLEPDGCTQCTNVDQTAAVNMKAPAEAEATCAALVKSGKVWCTATEDMDALPFGSLRLVRHLSSKKSREVEEFSLPAILQKLGMSQEQFVDLCILLGCDYCGKIWRLGPKKALKLLQQHGTIEQVLQNIDPQVHELKQQIEEREEELTRLRTGMYVTQTVEVESPTTLRSLVEAEEQNRGLLEQLSSQGERCQRLAEQLQGSEEVTAGLRDKISAYECEITQLREELLREISHLEAQKEEAVKEASECSEQHLEQLREQLTGVQRRLATLQPILKGMKTSYSSLRSQVRDFSEFYEAAIREARRQMCSAASEASEASRDLQRKYQHEVLLRKKYHAQLVELKGNIRVLCRLKPVTEVDQQEGEVSTAVSTEPGSDSSVTARYKGKERTFELDKVFLPEATQEEVFLEIEPLVLSCLDGYNVCIFAYGQTGSGKTYTMEGVPEDPGINQRALQALYREMEAREGLWKYSVSLSVVEIYNEVIRDLLGKEPQEKLDIKLNPDGSGQLHVPGLTSVEVQGLREIRKMLSLGKRNRATYCTNMNERSSRSHALLTVTITGTNCSSGTKTSGKLNLVDLAGSERVWKSGAQGERLKEAQNINKSLLALGEVIQALRAKQGHVPFRNSKLTYLLQDSLGKGNKTVMMVQISLLEKNAGETMCSLKFAQRVCKVELGPASRRIDSWGRSEL